MCDGIKQATTVQPRTRNADRWLVELDAGHGQLASSGLLLPGSFHLAASPSLFRATSSGSSSTMRGCHHSPQVQVLTCTGDVGQSPRNVSRKRRAYLGTITPCLLSLLTSWNKRNREAEALTALLPTFTIMKVNMTLIGMGQNALRVQSSSAMPLSARNAVHRGKGVRDRRIFRSVARRDATSAECAGSPNTSLSISRSQPRCFNAAGFQIKCLSSMPGWHSMRLKKQIMAKQCESRTSVRFGRFVETGGIFCVFMTR